MSGDGWRSVSRNRYLIVIALGGALLTSVLASTVAAQTTPVMCDGRVATIVGTPGRDRLMGTDGDDVIAGLQGNDEIYGDGGNDVICGGKGNDSVFGGHGFDIIFGAQGDDGLYADFGPWDSRRSEKGSRIFGGAGNDLIHGSNRWDRIQGGPGEDIIFGYAGRDWIRGGADSDDISGGPGIDNLHGGNGADRIATFGPDTVRGGAGVDTCILASEPALLRSCGRNRPEPTPTDGTVQFDAGTYAVPDVVPVGLYRTMRTWNLQNSDNFTIRGERQFDNSPTIAILHPQGATVQFFAEAVLIDAATPALNPFEFDQGRFIVGLDLAPGTYRVTSNGTELARAVTFTVRGQLTEIQTDPDSVTIVVGSEAGSFSFTGTLERL